MIRALLILAGLLVLLMAGALALLPRLLTPEHLGTMMTAGIKAATGYEVTFDSVQLTFRPPVGVDVRKLTVGRNGKTLLTAARAEAALGLSALLQRRLDLRRLVLTAPVMEWGGVVGRAKTSAAKDERANAAPDDVSLHLGVVRLVDGRLNGLAGGAMEQVNLDIAFPDGRTALTVTGDAVWKGQRRTGTARAASVADLSAGKPSAVMLRIVSAGPEPKTLALEGTLTRAGEAWALTDAVLALDDLRVTGTAKADMAPSRPRLTAALKTGTLDLDRFGAGTESANGGANDNKIPTRIETPDFSALNTLDAEATLAAERMSWKGLETGPATLRLHLQAGMLRLALAETAVAGGTLDFTAGMNAATPIPNLSFAATAKGLRADDVLGAFGAGRWMRGAVGGAVNLTTVGTNPDAWRQRLNGEAQIGLTQGRIEGLDIARWARVFSGPAAAENTGGVTDFSTLNGRFDIRGGVAETKDLRLTGPHLRARGEGRINIAARNLHLRVTATAGIDTKAVEVPLEIHGGFDDIRVRADMGAAAQKALSDPNLTKDLRAQGRALRDTLKTLKTRLRENPAAALESLLNSAPTERTTP